MSSSRGSDDLDHEAGYWCVAAGERLGVYDGHERWSVFAGGLTDPDLQVTVSLHERLHHELQHTTPWGVVCSLAFELARMGVQRERFLRLARFGREAARTVHETYATTLSVGLTLERSESIPAGYRTYLETGRRLAPPGEWESGRFQVDAALRVCMAGTPLSAARQLATLRVVDLDVPSALPDLRLSWLTDEVVASLPHPEAFGLRGSPDPSDLDHYYDAVVAVVNGAGLPTMTSGEVWETLEGFIAEVSALAPSLGERISVDHVRSLPSDDLDQHERERLYLHDRPLPLEVVPASHLAERAADFARSHRVLGQHVLFVWLRPDEIRAQFSGAALPEWTSDSPLVAAMAVGYDVDGNPLARLSPIPEVDPGHMARAMTTPAVFLTTASTLLVSPPDLDLDGIAPFFGILDGPLLQRVVARYGARVRIHWDVLEVRGDRLLYVLVARLDRLPGYIWLSLTGEAGRSYWKSWLESLPRELASRSAESFVADLTTIDAVTSHIVGAWWFMATTGEGYFDGI